MKTILFGIFLLAITTSFCQDAPGIISKPFIEVTGTASAEVVPDKIFISIILSDKVKDMQNYTIKTQEDNLRKALAKINIDLQNLYLADAESGIVINKKKESGVKLTRQFTLQVSNAAQVSKVFKELDAIDIKEATILRTESSKIDSLRREVRIAAIKAAKEKAQYLLTAIGEQIDKPLEIREQQDTPFYYRENLSNTSVNFQTADLNNKPAETNFEKFEIKFSYYIKYSIK
jgi:uncharacterized protein YggE